MPVLVLGLVYGKSHKKGSEAVAEYRHGKLTMRNHEISFHFFIIKASDFYYPSFILFMLAYFLQALPACLQLLLGILNCSKELENKYDSEVCPRDI